MRYLTARKRAEGKGASGTGTHEHWAMTVSGAGLAFIVPVWMYIFGSALGGTRAEVLEVFARPFPAVLTALLLIIGLRHFIMGATMMIEDYAHGSSRKIAIIATHAIAWLIGAFGIFALVKIAI